MRAAALGQADPDEPVPVWHVVALVALSAVLWTLIVVAVRVAVRWWAS